MLILLIGSWQILRTRDALVAAAEQNAQNLTRSLAQHAARTIDIVDSTLSNTVERVQADRNAKGLAASLIRSTSSLNQLRRIAVTNQIGQWIADSLPPHEPRDSGTLPEFAWHREHPTNDLHLELMRHSRYDGALVIPASKRWNNPDGTFAGIISAGLTPNYFASFYRTVQIGRLGTVALWSDDGHLLIRYPQIQEAEQSPASVITKAALFSSRSGVKLGQSPFDGVERIFAFEHVDNFPLIVSAGISFDEVLSPWRREACIEMAVMSIAIIALFVLGIGLERHRRRLMVIRRQVTQQSDLLQATINSMDQALVKIASDGTIELFNNRFAELFPLPKVLADKPKLHFEEFLAHLLQSGEYSATDQAFQAQVARKGAPLTLGTYSRSRPDGTILEVHTVSTADGAFVRTYADVTARHKADLARREIETRYRLLADNSTDMITHMDLTGKRLFVSPASFELLGYTPEQLVDTNPLGMIHPDDRSQLQAKFDDLAAGRISRAFNVNRLRHKHGHWIWVEASLKALYEHDGRAVGFVGSIRNISERKLADEALRRSEECYRLLADNASDMITQMDLTGCRLFVSPGARDLVGFEPQDLVGTSRSDFVHPDDEPALKQKIDDLVAGRTKRVANVNRVRHKDGWWIWVEASVKLLRDAEGRPSGFVSALRDVTDRKLADEALRQSEHRYRLLADNSTDLIALKSSFEGPRPYVSPSVFAMTGYTPDEFSKLTASNYVHPDDQAKVAGEFANLTPEQPEARSLHRVWHKAKRWIWVETEFRLIEADAPGRTVLVRSRDVTTRHHAELALAASEARYRVLAETTTDLITQLDLSMRRQYVSPACRHVLGFEPEEMLGRQPSADIHPEDAPEVRSLALRLVAGEVAGGRAVTTYRTRHKAGHWLWVEAGLNLVRDEATGEALSLICSLRDVTERQRVARHLENAKAEAEAAARTKAEFVANMSHELRTPLTGIIGVHDLLRADPGLTAAQRRLVDLAGEAGHSLLAIVNDVLDFSKADAGQLALEKMPFDFDALVASCCELARGQIACHAVELSVLNGPHRLGWMTGDPTRVRQILLNLLTNAVKFTERGEITVRASYRDEVGLLRVDIADTGIGVPPERIETLFERFTQADTSTTRRYGGTGLGLAICKLLTNLMGGQIGAEARAGGGSIFWFELQLDRSAGRPASQTEMINAPSMTINRKLLLAEDNAVNAEIVTAMLESRGYEVSLVLDGAAAVRAACDRMEPIDLILMDLQMPVMDGLAAAAAIRAFEARVGVVRLPIVGLTANALAEDADLCLTAGMDAHVAKPIDWTRLFTVLDTLLRPAARSQFKDESADTSEIDGVNRTRRPPREMVLKQQALPI